MRQAFRDPSAKGQCHLLQLAPLCGEYQVPDDHENRGHEHARGGDGYWLRGTMESYPKVELRVSQSHPERCSEGVLQHFVRP